MYSCNNVIGNKKYGMLTLFLVVKTARLDESSGFPDIFT